MRAWLCLVVALLWTACVEAEDDGSEPLPVATSSGVGGGGSSGTEASSTASTANATANATASTATGGPCDGGGPQVEVQASKTLVLLKGTVLAPAGTIDGQVLIDGGTIACVAEDCSAMAQGATVIQTHGVIAPGLIDTHNHILFDIFDESDWAPTMSYQNHNQWPDDPKYGAMVDAKQYLSGEAGPLALSCEMLKYGEMKALLAGTTSVVGSPGGVNRRCYGSLARTVDQSGNDLPDDNMQTATIFPSAATADGVCENFADGSTTAYVIHIAEGVDATSRNEFGKLGTVTTTDNCLYDGRTTIVHGTSLSDPEFMIMGSAGMSLAWSPRSNVFLYGASTDLTKTTDIPKALSFGINVALGPDWSIGGSIHMLDEMRFANQVDDAVFGNQFTSRDLVQMATLNGAKALGLEHLLGSLTVGHRADIAVFFGTGGDPYDAVLNATPKEVTMVFVDGRLLYGDASMTALGPDNGTCEPLDVCCRNKIACIAETGGDPADKLQQTLVEMTASLQQAISAYDELNLTQWDFAPIAPLFKCN